MRSGKVRLPPEEKEIIGEYRGCFIIEPIGEKDVTTLHGIGPLSGDKLRSLGFDKAYAVMGKFLLLKKDKTLFTTWLKETIQCKDRQARECYECLLEWCDEFL